jgi:Kef-type K+ transport system membrane component KefB
MKKILTYIILIGTFVAFTWLIIDRGNHVLRTANKTVTETSTYTLADKSKPLMVDSPENIFQQFVNNIKYPISILLLQVIIILVLSRIFGILFRKLGQQTVVGEIVAGIFLGPSVLGWLFPGFSSLIFPHDSFVSLQFISQIGLAFFMFVIGMDLDLSKIKNKTNDAVLISHISIILPFFLGTVLSFYIYNDLAPLNVSFSSFALFMGIAMSITAFPVLARIIRERGLTRTPLGVLIITCAAADDVTAWCLLAVVIAVVKAGSLTSALFTIGLTVSYIILMIYVIKPRLQKISERRINSETIDSTIIGVAFFILLFSAYFTEIIGIHALFGSFIAGVIMPNKGKFREILKDKVEDMSTILLLPIFFAFTGLRTQIGLLNDSKLWIICLAVIFLAIAGKLAGSAITAKIVGRTWKESLSIGVMMNTRGLMELVVLNIGYDLGILSPTIFAIMVLMALTTTLMTGPLLDTVNYFFKKKAVEEG